MSTEVTGSKTGRDQSVERSINTIDIKVLVGLAVLAAGSNIDVQRDRRLDRSRVVGEDLRPAVTPRVPRHSEPRLQIVEPVVELQVGLTLVSVGLLEIPTNANVELKVFHHSPVV